MRYISAIMMARKSRRSRQLGVAVDVGESFTAVASSRRFAVVVMSVVAVVVSVWVTWVMCRLTGAQWVVSAVVSRVMGWKVVVVMVVADVRNRFSAVRDCRLTSVVVVRLVEQERHNGKTIVHTINDSWAMGLAETVIDGGDELWGDVHFALHDGHRGDDGANCVSIAELQRVVFGDDGADGDETYVVSAVVFGWWCPSCDEFGDCVAAVAERLRCHVLSDDD